MTTTATGPYDPALLEAVIAVSSDTTTLLQWGLLAQQVRRAGRLTYPILALDGLTELFDAAAKKLDYTPGYLEFIRQTIPSSMFPVGDFADYLKKTAIVIDLTHRVAAAYPNALCAPPKIKDPEDAPAPGEPPFGAIGSGTPAAGRG